MGKTVQITIPVEWIKGLSLNKAELRAALRIGLKVLRRRQAMADTDDPVLKALLDTGLVSRLTVPLPEDIKPDGERQPPLKLPGKPLSQMIIEMRGGKLEQ